MIFSEPAPVRAVDRSGVNCRSLAPIEPKPTATNTLPLPAQPIFHDFSDLASDIAKAAGPVKSTRKTAAILRSNKVTAERQAIADEAAQAAAAAFEAVSDISADSRKFSHVSNLWEAFDDIPDPIVPGAVRPATDLLPLHFAPPSGLPTFGVFTVVFSTRETGKRVILNAQGVLVRTDKAIDRVNAKRKLAHAASRNPNSKFYELKEFDTFMSMACVGFANLEDVGFWCKLAATAHGYIVRSAMLPELAPAAKGVRRAVSGAGFGALDRPAFANGAGSLLVFDLDNIPATEGLDYHDTAALAELARKYLPYGVADTDFILTPTAGHTRPKKDGSREVRLRVYAIGDRPLGLKELTKWAPPLVGNIGCDLSVYKSSQAIYTSRICLDDATGAEVPDPFEAALWTMIHGKRPVVAIPEIDLMRKTNSNGAPRDPNAVREPKAPRKPGERVTYDADDFYEMSFDELVTSLGDHPGGGGFNDPQGPIIGRMVADTNFEPGPARAEQIVDFLTGVIMAADRSNRAGVKQPEDYVAGLPSHVDWYMDKEPERRRARAAHHFECYETEAALEAAVLAVAPLPTATLEEAQAGLMGGLASLLAIGAAWSVFPFLTSEETDEDGEVSTTFRFNPTVYTATLTSTVEAVQAELALAGPDGLNVLDTVQVFHATGIDRDNGPPTMAVVVQAGVGKTRTVIDTVNHATASDEPLAGHDPNIGVPLKNNEIHGGQVASSRSSNRAGGRAASSVDSLSPRAAAEHQKAMTPALAASVRCASMGTD